MGKQLGKILMGVAIVVVIVALTILLNNSLGREALPPQ